MKTRFEMIEIEDIPAEIIRKRCECNVTQVKLSEILNIPKSYMCRIESASVGVSLVKCSDIFKALGYKIQILITEEK